MHTKDLDFEYPDELIATDRAATTRVMYVEKLESTSSTDGRQADETYQPKEITLDQLIEKFRPNDVLVINNTQVLKRRVFAQSGLEILFLSENKDGTWQVLCPATKWKPGTQQTLPGGITLEITARGRPQTVKPREPLTDKYFEQYGELPLPPYIQKARDNRHNTHTDQAAYQTKWAQKPGSLAAPTASLHFTQEHLEKLKSRGVKIVTMTLHVGLGTFLPITADTLSEHEMHFEWAEVPKETWATITEAKANRRQVWAIGTTVTRTLESIPKEILKLDTEGNYSGETNLFIKPGFQFKVVDRLLTNFHQPKSTLLALVAAFSDLQTVKSCYTWAIEKKFRLFSYGDLTVWVR